MPQACTAQLRQILGERVSIANPFDFHTHVWFDRPAMRSMFSTAQRAGYDAVAFMVDCPPASQADPAAYLAAIEEFAAALPGASTRGAVISSLPESMAPQTRERCLAQGIAPLQGQREALESLALAAAVGEAWAADAPPQLRIPHGRCDRPARTLSESEAKTALMHYGVPVPRSQLVRADGAARLADAVVAAADSIGYPVVLKSAGGGLEHKSDVGGVIVDVRSGAEAAAAARRLAILSPVVLVEQMVLDGVAEVLIGVSVDPQFGQTLVLGSGGLLTELLRDSVSLLPPFTPAGIERSLMTLTVGSVLRGYRGRPPGDIAALVETALACSRYAEAQLEHLIELDMNPVIVRPHGQGVVAVDALIRVLQQEQVHV
jgi:acetyl-CoA synthetase